MRARVPLRLWPAVDVVGGRTAQDLDGSLADPSAAVAHWVAQGAERLHLVDLDRATGRGARRGLARCIPGPGGAGLARGAVPRPARAASTAGRARRRAAGAPASGVPAAPGSRRRW